MGFSYAEGAPAPVPGTAASDRAGTARLGLWLAMISLSMLFLALLGSLIVVRPASGPWPPEGVRLNLPLGVVNTAVILASSAALAAALHRLRRGRLRQAQLYLRPEGGLRKGPGGAEREEDAARTWLQAGGSLALLFLCLQTVQCYWLVENFGQTLRSGPFATFFYSLTGLHAVHLLVGVLWLGALMLRGKGRSPLAVELCGTYWHFVAGLWVVLFVVLYVI